MSEKIEQIYERLHAHFGPQLWWPGDTPFEIMVGAVLTQNTNWRNVEKAIDNLKGADLLSLAAMAALPVPVLADYIRPSGYYNIKAGRLYNLLTRIIEEAGTLEEFFDTDIHALREKLLSVKGIGPETADSIILYAAEKPVFVIDAYTHRILTRHAVIDEDTDYHAMQELFMDRLPEEVDLFNEYHALIVRTGKQYCKKGKPLCSECPLAGI